MTIRTVVVAAVVLTAAGLAAQQPATPAATPTAQVPARVPMTRYTMTAGDVTGDSVAETITYDTDSKALRVFSHTAGAPVQTMAIVVKDVVTQMKVADLDGDGRGELIAGEGLMGYNVKDAPQVDVSIKIYRPREKGDWSPTEIYRKASERPEVTSLQVRDVDGDGRQDILFAYFESKYITDIRLAKESAGAWSVSELPAIRMGPHVDAGDVLGTGKPAIVVGRPYGDPPDPKSTTAIGDAFILQGETRIPLPVTRGVSAVAVGNVDGAPGDEIVVSDGWHSNYGKLARCRLGLISRQANAWKYELIEDLEGHMRFEEIDVVDLTGDGKPEIVGRAARSNTLGGSIRVYERTASGWRGMTAAQLTQAYAAGDFDGDGRNELVFGGQLPVPFSLGARTAPSWDTALGPAVETRDVDASSLVGKPAPALQVTEWIGSPPQPLASLRGKVVMLDYWATWCGPCIAMYPEMRQWLQEFGPQGFVILGITNHSQQTSAEVRRFYERNKLPWPVAIDPTNATHRDYGVSPIPHTFLIDRQGAVRFSHVGGGDLSGIKAKLRELLAEGPADRR